MKIALITDIHYGVRSDNIAFLDNNKKFFDELFFPTLKEQGIDTVICLGDLLDRRKYVNYYTSNRLRQDFIYPSMKMGINFHWILGNHDIFWRNKTDVNAATELYGGLPSLMEKFPGSFHIHEKAKEVEFDGTKILFVPWICDSNREATFTIINNTDASICFGHLEIDGFEMHKGVVNTHGDNPELFQKFDLVCSGHYHHRSVAGNIHYLGATSEFTWSDYNDDRGFHIFDSASRSLDYIVNPYVMFRKAYYHDASLPGTCPDDFETLRGKIVKVIVKSRTNSDQYNSFITKCEAAQPLDMVVVEDHLNLDMINDELIVSETKDTLTIIREFVSQTNEMVESDKLDKMIVKLYNEAQQNMT